jgi:membrane protein implicated in regulation of membrane protease activity
MNAEWLLNWWNLIFLLPFGLALMYLGLYTVSGLTFGDSDVDHDFDADADTDVDADADADANADADHDLDADHDADGDSDADHDADGDEDAGHGSTSLAALTWLGLGKVPVSLLLMVLFLTWGVVGFVANAAMQSRGASAAIISVPLAAVASLLMTRLVATTVARVMPLNETTARRRHALLGLTGEAIFAIDQRFGMVSVRDDMGDLYQVACRAQTGGEAIPKGTQVTLVAYNAKQGIFYVTRHPITSTTAA